MRLFGYYALHAFWNQIRKIFKTWVLVFILVCGLMGGLIGLGTAALTDAAMEENGIVEEELPVEEEAVWELPISKDAMLELVAGGIVLVLLGFEAFTADKNGSKIFQPADVSLLFASPMRPQSVLMFRLATQMGMALAMVIYLSFQLPNLVLNLGLSIWAAVALILTVAAALLVGKLMQVLLYLLSSKYPRFRHLFPRALYAAAALIAGGYYLCFLSGGRDYLMSADRFFNGSFTRLIPFWGWLKGFSACLGQQQFVAALGYLAVSILGCGAMVFFIQRMDVDFYEDAMAKSEETAARLEKARSEKSTGVAATQRRRKERKDTLLRDGLNRGQGANIFFFKTLYNRCRFAHFHFFTKTMETYLAAGIGAALITRFFMESETVLPAVLTLGGLVFFRAMGNPLEEDTGMDFFRMIPESTWKKLIYSQLGGTANCLLDLVPAMLCASAVLTVNPLRLLVWLPVILSVDFYASSVGAFIDLSVPVSAGKTIKQLVQIMFIYFGLLPDIAILAVAIVFKHTLIGALGAAVLNILLGFLFFTLAAVYLEPRGRDYVPEVKCIDYTEARAVFSRIGLSIFVLLASVVVLQFAFGKAVSVWLPEFLETDWALWILSFVPIYCVGMPVCIRMMRKIPSVRLEEHSLGLRRGVLFFFICLFLMYGGNVIGTMITVLLNQSAGTNGTNPLEVFVDGGSVMMRILVMVILAPILEEYVFRKHLIDRMHRYGGRTSVILSALLFGLFHGNLNQFFYAFGLGLAFGYIYLNTGRLRYSIIAHILINFTGTVVSVALMSRAQAETEFGLWSGLFYGYTGFVIISALLGLVMLCVCWRSLHFPAGERELPKGTRFRVSCCNTGMVLAILGCLGLFCYSLIG